jgi:hypothetical protein
MGLFGKHKDNKEVKKVETQEETTFVELGEPISNQIIRDVQKHLHLGAKQERPTLPLFISVSRIPNPENFVDFDTLLAEVNQEDEEDRLAREAKEKKEAEAKALKEKQEQEQLEANKQKQEVEEIPQEEVIDEIELEELEDQVEEDNLIVEPETETQSEETPIESESNIEESLALESEETPTLDNVEASKEELEENVDENKEEIASDVQEEVESPIDNENVTTEQINNTQEETVSQDIEQNESNEQENIENNTQDESLEQECLAKEEAEKQEQERLAKEKEEEEKKKAELAKKKGPTITSISAANLKGAKRGVVKASAVKKGGVSAAKEASDAIKEKEEEKKKKAAQARIEAKRASEKEAEMARLATVSMIGTDKKPKPENGKFEIQWSNDNVKPYKLVLKNDQGKVLYESTPIKTKPNELTATTFRNILSTGSFVFISTPVGYAFKILDSRMRVFHVSKAYRNAIDAQKLAAQIKKFGLSANYIDDLTKA